MARSRAPAPPISEAIGILSMSWASVEIALTVILTELMETNVMTGMIVSAALDYRRMCDLINSLAAVKLKGTDSLENITGFMAQVNGMNKERNKTIHAIWHNDPDTGTITRLTMRNRGAYKMEFKRISTRHLKTVQGKMAELSYIGVSFAPQLRKDVRAWSEKQPPLDWPDLTPEAHPTEAIPDKP